MLKIVSYFVFILMSLVSHAAPAKHAMNQTIRLATTTSTENSGLLHFLLPEFEQQSGYKVHVIAVGTGKALKMGQAGDVDVLLVHAKEAENAFIKQGFGRKRYAVMYNDFILIGPANDPAAISTSPSAAIALERIDAAQQLFISRGDDSGTHKKEKKLWAAATISPAGQWYREIGQGMGKAIQMADELDAYTLTDRGTWLSYKDKTRLKLLYQGDKLLFNPYGIIAVNPKLHADINARGADALIQWLISAPAQQLIGQYKKHGQLLFTPAAGK